MDGIHRAEHYQGKDGSVDGIHRAEHYQGIVVWTVYTEPSTIRGRRHCMTVSTFSETPPKNGILELRSAGLIITFLAES